MVSLVCIWPVNMSINRAPFKHDVHYIATLYTHMLSPNGIVPITALTSIPKPGYIPTVAGYRRSLKNNDPHKPARQSSQPMIP